MEIQLHRLDQPLKQLEIDLRYGTESTLARDFQFDEYFSESLSLFDKIRVGDSSISALVSFIERVENVTVQSDFDRNNFRSPYHNIILAYAYYLIGDLEEAKKYAELSASDFRTQSKYWHEVICQWFLILLFYEMGQTEKASEKEKYALEKIQDLDKEDIRRGHYIGGYKNIHDTIKESCAAVKAILYSEPVVLRPDMKPMSAESLSTIIDWLNISNFDFQLSDYRKKISSTEHVGIESLNEILSALGKRLETMAAEENKEPIINLLIAHCYNLGFLLYPEKREYQFSALEYAGYALSDYREKNDDYNHALCCWYVGLMSLNNGKRATFQALVKNGLHLLDKFVKSASSTNQYAQNTREIKRIFFSWFESPDLSYRKTQQNTSSPPPNISLDGQSSWPKKNRNDKTEQRSGEDAGPSETPYHRSDRKEKSTSLPESQGMTNSKPSHWNEPPTPPSTPNLLGQRDDSHFRLLVVPIDLSALDRDDVLNSPLVQGPDLFKKLESFGLEYNTRKGPFVGHPGRKSTQPKTLIRSFPINMAESAESAKTSSRQEMADIVDETLKLKIQDKKYEVFLKKGIKEVFTKNHEWFLVTDDGLNNSDPITVEKNDYVLVNKKNCSPKFCNGQIVLVSIRERDNAPPRFLVRKFLFMGPKPPDVEVTAPFIATDTLKGTHYVLFTDEYQIVGEVVAIAKLIEE